MFCGFATNPNAPLCLILNIIKDWFETGRIMKTVLSALITSGFLGLASVASACGHFHVVQAGETLAQVAEKNLGSVFQFGLIKEANASLIRSGDLQLEAGHLLDLPCLAPSSDVSALSTPVAPTDLWALMRNMGDVQVLDIRSLSTLAAGVLPKTVAIPYDFWQAPNDISRPGSAADHIANVIGGAGLRLDRPIAILHGEDAEVDAGRALFVSWLLKSAGAKQTAIISGGYPAWVSAGLPITVEMAGAEPYELDVTLSSNWRKTAGRARTN